MLNFLKKKMNTTYTENNAVTYRSTENFCLDFFYKAGALRNASEDSIVSTFVKAYTENPDLAMKILFFARDIRGGLGERKIFRTCMKWLAIHQPESAIKNIGHIAEFGRYDDLLSLLETRCENAVMLLIREQLELDCKAMQANKEEVSLLAKWLPSINTSSTETVNKAKKIARALKYSDAQYRRTLAELRRYIDIIENRLREMDYTFDYEKQASKAMFKYKKAFIRNDKERYMMFLSRVQTGEAVLKTGSLYPYDVIREALHTNLSAQQRIALDTSWNSLADYGKDDNAIAVIDGSGSMYGGIGTPKPFEAALALGIYFAEHSKGAFANHFITFSQTPQLVELKGRDIAEKACFAASFNEVANTNIEAVFQLILDTAVQYRLPQSQLPNTVYIISDMEFDTCANNASLSNFENAKKLFARVGYKLPNVVFWNVNSRNEQVPVRMHDTGSALVSGSSAKIFEMVRSGNLDPMMCMLEIVENERYKVISA